jgi:hypothetical protein
MAHSLPAVSPDFVPPLNLIWPFRTTGADGTINFWDKDSRTRLKSI